VNKSISRNPAAKERSAVFLLSTTPIPGSDESAKINPAAAVPFTIISARTETHQQLFHRQRCARRYGQARCFSVGRTETKPGGFIYQGAVCACLVCQAGDVVIIGIDFIVANLLVYRRTNTILPVSSDGIIRYYRVSCRYVLINAPFGIARLALSTG
jgi:hypothetical protein